METAHKQTGVLPPSRTGKSEDPFSPGRGDRRLFALSIAGMLALFGYRLFQFWGFTADDAYITLRQARNLVHGHGLVYNIGGPAVEAYTSHVMFLMQALFVAAGVDAVHATKVLGSLAGVGTLLISVALARHLVSLAEPQLQVSRVTLLAGPYVAALSPVLALGAVSGLETTVYVGLLTAAVWRVLLLVRTPAPRLWEVLGTGVLLGLTTWTRPEGIAWVVGLALTALLACRHAGRPTKMVLGAFVPGLLIWAVLIGFRLAVFERIHPNTYYAKMGGAALERLAGGLAYARDWALHNGGGAMLLLALAGTFLLPASRRAPALICLVLVLGQVALAIYEGGDWIPHLRMLAPLTGVLAALASLGVALLLSRLPVRRIYTASVAGMVLLSGVSYLALRPELHQVFREVQTRVYGWNDAHRPLGQWLARWQKERSAAGHSSLTAALMDIGLVGWLAPDVRIIDLGGLADPDWAELIHQSKGRANYPVRHLLSQVEPEVIVLVSLSPPGAPLRWWPGSDPVIFAHPQFRRNYTEVATYAHKNFPGDAYFLRVFVRSPLLREAPVSQPPKPRTT